MQKGLEWNRGTAFPMIPVDSSKHFKAEDGNTWNRMEDNDLIWEEKKQKMDNLRISP